MTPEKRRKIKALLDNPASTENEKEICRRLLGENSPKRGAWSRTQHKCFFPDCPLNCCAYGDDRMKTWQAPRSRESGDFWRQATQNQQDAARRQRQAAWGARVSPSTDDLDEMLKQARKEQQDLWNDMRHHLEDMNLKPGPLTDFYKELERLRKERDK